MRLMACRAENSHTARHLAEFWMIEPEMAFADLDDDMRCAEDYVQHCCRHLLANCMCAFLLWPPEESIKLHAMSLGAATTPTAWILTGDILSA